MDVENIAPRNNKRMFSNGASDTTDTPEWLKEYIFDQFPCDFTPCVAGPENPNFNGLSDDWQGFSFVHPPYSETQAWVERAAAQADRGNFSVVLVPANFNSVYWRETVYQNATEIRVFICPIKFNGHKKQIVSQMALVAFGGRTAEEKLAGFPPVCLIEPEN